MATNDKQSTALTPTGPSQVAPFTLNSVAIEAIQHNIRMAQQLVTSVLEKDVDYGKLPGLDGMTLFDSGAANIMNALQCYPKHEVIYHQEDDNLISWVVAVSIINRESQQVIGHGVGACSTREPKYKYRWVFKPEEYGFSPEQVKTLKVKDGKYRIPNPEYGELCNTIFLMASKRAEVDATRNLPGVGSGLKKLFTGKMRKVPEGPDWSGFWGWVNSCGLDEKKAHEIIGLTSLNDWLKSGHTLEEARQIILRHLQKQTLATEEGTPSDLSPERAESDELFPEDDLTLLRQEIGHLLGQGPRPADTQLENWWKKKDWGYSLQPQFFASAEPLPTLAKPEHLKAFRDDLVAYQERQAQTPKTKAPSKTPTKKAPPPETIDL